MADAKTYEDVTGTKTGTYEEALVSRKLRDGFSDGEPQPDRPTGAAVHVNPAINPAPHYEPKADRIPVPVINDPGVLGSAPSLQQLNAAAAVSYGAPLPDQTSGMSEDSNREEIRAAAEARQEDIVTKTKEAADKAMTEANSDAAPVAEQKTESKLA